MNYVIANQSADWCGNPFFERVQIRNITPICAMAHYDLILQQALFAYMKR